MTVSRMIRALMLVLNPSATWEKIEADPRNVARTFFLFLLPLMLLSAAVEGWGLWHFGVERSTLADLATRRVNVSTELAVRYEVAQLGFGLLIVLGGAWLFRLIGEGFHRRHSYAETFTTLAYSTSPLFLLRMFDALPGVNTW